MARDGIGARRKRPNAPFYGPGAPILVGWASPLRVATGGNANWSSEVRSRRSPAHENKRREHVHLPSKRRKNGTKTWKRGTRSPPGRPFCYPRRSRKSQKRHPQGGINKCGRRQSSSCQTIFPFLSIYFMRQFWETRPRPLWKAAAFSKRWSVMNWPSLRM